MFTPWRRCTDRSQEGNQFVKGFGGIGGLLRYKVDFGVIADALDGEDDEFFDSDDDFSTFASCSLAGTAGRADWYPSHLNSLSRPFAKGGPFTACPFSLAVARSGVHRHEPFETLPSNL